MGRKCFLITLFFFECSLGFCWWGEDGVCQQTQRRGEKRRREKEGEWGRSAPPVSDKGPLPPFCLSFSKPLPGSRGVSRYSCLSVSSFRKRAHKQRAGERQREGRTDRDTEKKKAGQCHRLSRARLSELDKKEKNKPKNSSSRLNRMRKPLWFVMLMQHRFSVQCKSISKSLICALTFSRQIISKCSVNAASQIISSMPPGTNWTLTIS